MTGNVLVVSVSRASKFIHIRLLIPGLGCGYVLSIMNGQMVLGLRVTLNILMTIAPLFNLSFMIRSFLSAKQLVLVFLVSLSVYTYGQTSNSSADQVGERLAERIAGRIADSLKLPQTIKERLYSVNLLLHREKMVEMRSGGNRATVAAALQRIENRRDSLYKQILPAEQFAWYKERKGLLISNN